MAVCIDRRARGLNLTPEHFALKHHHLGLGNQHREHVRFKPQVLARAFVLHAEGDLDKKWGEKMNALNGVIIYFFKKKNKKKNSQP